MRPTRAIWIAAGILVLGAVVLFLSIKPGQVSAQVLGETNGYRTVLIRNPTAHPYYVIAWGEFYRNDAWERLSLINTVEQVEPGKFIETGIPMPTNTPRRVVLVYRPIKTGGIGGFIAKTRLLLRLKPHVEREYIDVE